MRVGRQALVAGCALLAMPLLAAPQSATTTRIAGYRAMGAAFKTVKDQLRTGEVQLPALKVAAATILTTSKSQYSWFPAGSGPEAGGKTAAKPEIWTQAAAFKAAQDKFAMEATAFSKVVAGGNTDAIGVQFKKLGDSCSACHRPFRVDEKKG